MEQDTIETFGKWLVTQVRDRCVRNLEAFIQGEVKNEQPEFQFLKSASPEERGTFLKILPLAIDGALGEFLGEASALDDSAPFQLVLQSQSQSCPLSDLSDSLVNDYFRQSNEFQEEGWLAKYSNHRP